MTEKLTEQDAGDWAVTTGSGSVHVFSIRPDGKSTVTRMPRAAEQTIERDLIADLRRDGETLELLGLTTIEVGKDAMFGVNVREDGVATVRRTTTVVSIERLEEDR